jgi:hypothetical protein
VRVERTAASLLIAWAVAAGPAGAQSVDRFVLRGLQDVEAWKTDAGSLLLSKNDGELAGAGRLRLWAGAEFVPGFQAVLLGRLEGGKAEGDGDTNANVEQAFLRYVSTGSAHLMIDAGRIVAPLGNFSKRYLSSVNPLIASPDSYDVAYPEGVLVTGKVAFFDYRAAIIDKPIANESYVPHGDTSWRPTLDVGFTPVLGLRIGGYFTQGTYLGEGVAWAIPAGQGWRDFDEEIVGATLEFSHGYFELNGDIAFSAYDVPTVADRSRGQAWFIEPKYTFTPRLFAALRLEKNDYPYIQPLDATTWIAQNVTFHDVEVGLGWRFTPGLVLKGSYRRDRWDVSGPMASFFPNGYACGLQLSYAFDLRSWMTPRD